MPRNSSRVFSAIVLGILCTPLIALADEPVAGVQNQLDGLWTKLSTRNNIVPQSHWTADLSFMAPPVALLWSGNEGFLLKCLSAAEANVTSAKPAITTFTINPTNQRVTSRALSFLYTAPTNLQAARVVTIPGATYEFPLRWPEQALPTAPVLRLEKNGHYIGQPLRSVFPEVTGKTYFLTEAANQDKRVFQVRDADKNVVGEALLPDDLPQGLSDIGLVVTNDIVKAVVGEPVKSGKPDIARFSRLWFCEFPLPQKPAVELPTAKITPVTAPAPSIEGAQLGELSMGYPATAALGAGKVCFDRQYTLEGLTKHPIRVQELVKWSPTEPETILDLKITGQDEQGNPILRTLPAPAGELAIEPPAPLVDDITNEPLLATDETSGVVVRVIHRQCVAYRAAAK